MIAATGRSSSTRYADDPEHGALTEETVRVPDGAGYRSATFTDGLGREYLDTREAIDGRSKRARETQYSDASGLGYRRARWHEADASCARGRGLTSPFFMTDVAISADDQNVYTAADGIAVLQRSTRDDS